MLNQEKPNPLFSQSISKNNCHDHLFPQSRSENKCQGDLFLSQLSVIEKEIRKVDTMDTKEAWHMSTASGEGECEKIHKFPHEVAGKINASTCSLFSHPLPRASAKTITQPEPTNPLCVQCSWANESALHALWSCGELDAIWEDLNMWSCRNILSFITFKELLSWLINHQHHLVLFSVTAWSITAFYLLVLFLHTIQ